MREILGKVDGLKNSVLNALEQLYDLEIPDWQVLTAEALEKMASITAAINREVNIYVDRHGKVVSVAVGDSSTVTLPDVDLRRGRNRLSGVRCIHTHPGGDERLSGIDLSALRNNRYDLMAAIGVDEEKVQTVIDIIREHSHSRKQMIPTTTEMSYGYYPSMPVEVVVGGATIFVVDIERFERV